MSDKVKPNRTNDASRPAVPSECSSMEAHSQVSLDSHEMVISKPKEKKGKKDKQYNEDKKNRMSAGFDKGAFIFIDWMDLIDCEVLLLISRHY